MKYLSVFLLGFATVSVAFNASAQERKFQLALRSGYSIPMGNVASAGNINVAGTTLRIPSDVKMSDDFSYRVPIWLDAGYMITPNLMLGIYFQYGFVGTKTRDANMVGCSSGSSCSAHDIHYGIQAQYYFMPGEGVNPWLGLGFGRESLSYSTTTQGQSTDASASGWTFALLQAGVDFRAADAFALGPFAAFSFGQYSTVSEESRGVSVDLDLPTAMHEWLTLGVKGQFGF